MTSSVNPFTLSNLLSVSSPPSPPPIRSPLHAIPAPPTTTTRSIDPQKQPFLLRLGRLKCLLQQLSLITPLFLEEDVHKVSHQSNLILTSHNLRRFPISGIYGLL